MLITEKKVPAGRPGTKKLIDKYGDDLLCVRYRYDPELEIRVKTIELIIDRKTCYNSSKKKAPSNKIMCIRIEYGEKNLGILVKNAGGRWNKERKLWELSYEKVRTLGLMDRIVSDE